MFIFFAILSGLFFGALSLFQRHLLKGNQSDPFAHSFFFSFTSALFILPFMLAKPAFNSDLWAWGLVLLLGLVVVAQNLLSFYALKHASASITGTIAKFRVIWVLLLGIALSHESWSNLKGLGIMLTVIAGILLVARFNQRAEWQGVMLAFIATLFYAVGITIYTPLLAAFNIVTVTFLLFTVPTVLNFILMKNAIPRIQRMYQQDGWRLLVLGFLSSMANLTMIAAISLGDASPVLAMSEAILIVVILLGEFIILREHQHMTRKILAMTMAGCGAALIHLSV